MSNQFIFIIMGIAVAGIVIMGILYYILQKKMQKSEYKKLQKLQQGTRSSTFSSEVMYQKLYILCKNTIYKKVHIKTKKKIRNFKY